MGTLKEDIKKQSEWLVKAFKSDNLKLNYTVESFKLLDDFFDKHSEKLTEDFLKTLVQFCFP
jgi:hypothetical protein